jgi:hypothetical protein
MELFESNLKIKTERIIIMLGKIFEKFVNSNEDAGTHGENNTGNGKTGNGKKLLTIGAAAIGLAALGYGGYKVGKKAKKTAKKIVKKLK